MHRSFSVRAGFLLGTLALAALPAVSSAQTATGLQAQITALMAQIAQLQGTHSTPISQPDDYGTGNQGASCPNLSVTMQRGSTDASTGGQVSGLQTFLASHYNLNEEDVITGYFGAATKRYVVQFQQEQGLPALGIVGQLTRAKIADVCGGGVIPNGSITVTAPNGGEQWDEGVLNTVTWTPYQYNPDINPAKDVTAYLEVNDCKPIANPGPECFRTIGKVQESGKASIHWITGELNSGTQSGVYAPPGDGYYIRVVNNVTGAWDRSDAPFTLKSKKVDLKLNGADGPVTLVNPQTVTLSWSASNVTNCGIYVARVNGISPVSPTGSMQIQVDPSVSPYVNISCNRIGTGESVSDYVTILNNGAHQSASLSVLSPNGGEKVVLNQPYTVRWAQKGLNSVSVAVYKNDQWLTWLVKDSGGDKSTDDTYSFTWTPSGSVFGATTDAGTAALGNIFKIYITGQKADGTGYVDDKSDSAFAFTSTAATAELSVSYSVSPHTVTAGQEVTERWSSVNAKSCAYGWTYADGTPGSSHDWTPNDASNATAKPAKTVTVTLKCIGLDGTTKSASDTVTVTPKTMSCTYSRTNGRATTIDIEGGQDACSSWCTSQAAEENTTYSCSYAGNKIASAQGNQMASAYTALASALTALLGLLK